MELGGTMQKKKNKKSRFSDQELRNYYDGHSATSSKGKVREVRMSFPKPRRLVALRLEEKTLKAIRHIAAQKGLNYSTLMRMWITERLNQE
jgi:predicted DNA binding CopG/RHH family protein